MPLSTNMAWAQALQSLGQTVPNILRQYNQDVVVEQDRNRKAATKAGAEGILKGLPVYGSALEELSAGMTPQKAQETLAQVAPEERQAAVDIMSGKRGLDALRLAMPAAPGTPPSPQGSALGAVMQPAPGRSRRDVIEQIRPVIRDMESGGRYGIAHPRAKSGKQAMGAYGIVPEIWFQAFPDFKLNPHNPEDKKRFLETPAIQDAMFNAIAERGLEETGGDLRKFRAWYYGGPSAVTALDTDAGKKPEFAYDAKGNLIPMPSRTDDAADFMRRLDEAGVDTSALAAGAPASLPWDNSLLEDLVKEKPTMKTLPKKVSYGDQEKYLLSKVKDPDQYALLKDYITNISKLAENERGQEKDRVAGFEKELDRYGDNVRKNAQLHFDTWKERGDRQHRSRTYQDQTIQALRAQRESLQKQLADVRGFQTRVASGKESPEMLAAAYPDFFTTKTKDPGVLAQIVHGGDAEPSKETAFDSARFSDAVKRLEQEIQAIDEAMSYKSGASVLPAAEPTSPLSKYLKPRN